MVIWTPSNDDESDWVGECSDDLVRDASSLEKSLARSLVDMGRVLKIVADVAFIFFVSVLPPVWYLTSVPDEGHICISSLH